MTRTTSGFGWMAAALALLGGVGLGGCAGEPRLLDSFTDSLDAAGVVLLYASVETGALTVIGEAGATTLDVQVDVTTTRTSQSKDEDALHAAHLEFRETADGTALLSVWLDPEIDKYATDVTVTMPAGLDTTALVSDGATSVQGAGAVSLDTDAGDVEVLDARGDVKVVDKAGALLVDGVVGNVTLDDGAGDLEVSDVDGDLEIDDGAGDITVAHVTGHVTIRDSGGEIDIDDVGSVTIE